MDFAREHDIPLCGWCPKNGWAEDYTVAPGLLKDYPELTETPSEGTEQRTKWNMRDCNAILTILPEETELCIGGPRASEWPEAYEVARCVLESLSKELY